MKHIEIDSSKHDVADTVNMNLIALPYLASCWKALKESLDYFPVEIKEVLTIIKELANGRFPEDAYVQYTSVSGFVFLRFIGSSIISVIFLVIIATPSWNYTRGPRLKSSTTFNLNC
jgi:hypothetical protein